MQILDMTPEHLEGAVEVIRVHSGEFFYPHEIASARARFQSIIAQRLANDGDARLGVAQPRQVVGVEDGVVLGTMGYVPEEGALNAYQLSYVAVHPDAMGKGIGRALWEALEHDLREQDARIVYTWTSPLSYTERPRRFYESLGFRCACILPDYWMDGDDLAIFAYRFEG